MSRHHAGDVIDHYEILDSLGEGAYAEVYKARDQRDGKVVVLKSPNPTMFADPSLYQRYKRETSIARTLAHRNIQCSLDAGEHRSEPYLVLEFVDGTNLRRAMRAYEGGVPVAIALDWATQLADALAYLHDHGIVHRDLKPENVLVATDGTLKVADFGTAMMVGARRLTWRHLSESLGTPDYMSPEQIQGERGDARSDLYSWGVLVYELLAGQVPFPGDNWMAAMAGHLQKSPKPIRGARRDCPPALEAVVLHAMRRYPEHRYQSATELRADLGRLATLDPSSFDVSPEPPMGGMAATSAQHLWLFILLVAVGFLAVVAAILTLTVVLR